MLKNEGETEITINNTKNETDILPLIGTFTIYNTSKHNSHTSSVNVAHNLGIVGQLTCSLFGGVVRLFAPCRLLPFIWPHLSIGQMFNFDRLSLSIVPLSGSAIVASGRLLMTVQCIYTVYFSY